jgi:hypothetical protein
MAKTLATVRRALKVSRGREEVELELRDWRRKHTRESRGFATEAHKQVDAFTASARERLGAAMEGFLAQPHALLRPDLDALSSYIARLAVLGSAEFAATLHAAIDAGNPDEHGRPWASISYSEYIAKVEELQRELADIENLGRAEEADRRAAEAARERDEALAGISAPESVGS